MVMFGLHRPRILWSLILTWPFARQPGLVVKNWWEFIFKKHKEETTTEQEWAVDLEYEDTCSI